MKTKYILLTLATLALYSCEDYTEHHFGTPEELWTPNQEVSKEYELTEEDYLTVVNDGTNRNRALNDGFIEKLDSAILQGPYYLDDSLDAESYLKILLPRAMGSAYYYCTTGSTARMTYTAGSYNEDTDEVTTETKSITFELKETKTEAGKDTLVWTKRTSFYFNSLLSIQSTDRDAIYSQYGWRIEHFKPIPEGLTYIWSATTSYGMKASAYKSQSYPSDAWLITPALDFSKVKQPVLSFETVQRYGDADIHNSLQILVSTNYVCDADGNSNFKTLKPEKDWVDMQNHIQRVDNDLQTEMYGTGADWNFVNTYLDLSAYAGQSNVRVAFRYISTESVAATWEIKNVKGQEKADLGQ